MLLAPAATDNSFAEKNVTSTYIQLPGDIMEVTYYYSNGSVKQTGYILNELKTGTWTTFSQSGKVMARAYYENGEKEGKWKIYTEAGDLKYKILYHNNKKVWAQQYSDTGELIGFNYK